MPDPSPRRRTLCIGVLTLNEERRIAQCLRSAAFADRIVVLDSGSTDRTRDIAAECGAEVHQASDWQGFAVQRNRLLAHCREDYVFFLDADEVITDRLREEILRALAEPSAGVWEIYWQQVAFGRPIVSLFGRHGIMRLFPRAQLLRFDGAVHECPVLSEPAAVRRMFKAPLLHYSRESVHESLRKLTQYAMLGAVKRAEQGRRGGVWRGLASGVAIFIRLYLFRAHFLSGGPGFLHSFFIALECFFRYAALKYDRETLSGDVLR